ncbi:MAG: adenylate/guanylate cyclase domain-containing protein, partial [Actinomycetota bacterium]
AAKRPDIGTSLAVGPFSGSIVARAATAALEEPDDDLVVTDLDFYNAVPGVPIGVAASPVRDENGVIGAIVLTYDGRVYTDDLTQVTEVATVDEDFVGADLYLIGADGTTRSDPQPYVESPRTFLDESVDAGVLSDADRVRIDANGTTILIQPAVDATYNDALDGDTNISERSSMTGEDVAGSVAPVPSDLVEWFVVAEIGVEAAQAATQDFRDVLIVGSAIFVLVVAFAAVAWANNVMRPVRMISERLVRRDDATPLEVPDRSPVEFHRLAASFRSMARSLRRQRDDLATARADRLDTMEQMLPASVAKRIADGNVEALDEVPNATVLVIVVLGLADLAAADDVEHGAQRELIDRLHAEIDDLAFEYGVDRIKVVGDAYFGSCGHDRPYIDHAPRVISFAREVIELLREISADSPADLHGAIGVHTGPVTVGLSGGARLVYDVWGDTVTTAHHLARRARADEILASGDTTRVLPEEIETTALDGGRGSNGDADDAAWVISLETAEVDT